jgi:hypothetical protein
LTVTTNDKENRDLSLAETGVRRWLRAIIMQGRRCEEANSRLLLAIQRGGAPWQEIMADYKADCWIEEHFFLIALAKALTWLRILARWRPEDRARIKEFVKSQPHAVDLRDMREHDDEYLRGGGRRRQRLHHEAQGAGASINFPLHATDTTISGSEYVLGGRCTRAVPRAVPGCPGSLI